MNIQKKEPDQLKILENSFYSIFKNNDPFDCMYKENIDQRLVLYPTNGYFLTEKQFDVLVKTLSVTKESKFYISEIETENCFLVIKNNDNHYQCKHWEADVLMDYDEYCKLPIAVENAIYSINGNWGIQISHEEHAVIGGKADFIKIFKTFYSGWQNDYLVFLEHWEFSHKHYGSNIDWLKDFITCINPFYVSDANNK